MTLSKANGRTKQNNWSLGEAISNFKLTVARSPWWQWLIATAVGLVLAAFLLVSISWKPRYAPFLALAALFPFAAIIVGDIRKLLLAAILIETPLHLDINLFYNWQAVYYNAIGGLNISITTFCLTALYALWVVDLLAKASTMKRAFRASLPMIVYLFATVLSLAVAEYVRLGFFEVFLHFQTFLLLLYIINFVQSREDVLFIVTFLFIGLAFESLVMIGLKIIGHSIRIAGIRASIDISGRVIGTLGSPNTASSYLELLLAPALAVLMTPVKRLYKWMAVTAFSLGMVALILTYSRGGWLAFVVSGILLCLVAFSRGWLSLSHLVIIAFIGILLLVVFWEPIHARLFGDDLGAADSRITMAKQALRVIEAHPIFGVGVNNYAFWYKAHPAPEIDGTRLRTAHNRYLLVWAETGVIGLLAFLGFLFTVIRRGWKVVVLKDPFLSPLILGFTVAVVGQMSHMFFDIFHSRPQVQTLGLVTALIIAVHSINQDQKMVRAENNNGD